jgi:hypothetical protein
MLIYYLQSLHRPLEKGPNSHMAAHKRTTYTVHFDAVAIFPRKQSTSNRKSQGTRLHLLATETGMRKR